MQPGRPIPEPVRRARRLFDEGKFQEAAEAFENLAQGAEKRGMVFQAANLTLQAARCYLRLDDLDLAYERAMTGLELLKEAGRPSAARQVAEKMVKVLREKGRSAEADALERELEQLPAAARPGARRGELPGKCSQCGAPIRETDIAWIGASSAECPYCGSVVKTE
jgi:thioredoxin-like negative regulator of GroEL